MEHIRLETIAYEVDLALQRRLVLSFLNGCALTLIDIDRRWWARSWY